MGAQQSANSTIPRAAPEPEHRATMDSINPKTDVSVPDKPSTPIQSSLAAQAGGGDSNAKIGGAQVNEEKKKLKPCCACPETKKIRDECIMEQGEENCQHLIEAHKACMRSLGFNI